MRIEVSHDKILGMAQTWEFVIPLSFVAFFFWDYQAHLVIVHITNII
ncbi:hypothetical protein M5D96_005420 [Drosophila gunungcola]|uniref:Uncharacterized protein n=1 Tax=Drosophila gunungcola TaxID=103775 RepID=A0A9Q0BR57_9MUSC|nr:hypothetical protein M5D96_005420 [Drosophila gunungcola]